MPVRGKTAHVRTNYGNDRLRAGVPDTGYILDCLGSLFFLRLHEVVDLIIQIFNVDVHIQTAIRLIIKIAVQFHRQRSSLLLKQITPILFQGFYL